MAQNSDGSNLPHVAFVNLGDDNMMWMIDARTTIQFLTALIPALEEAVSRQLNVNYIVTIGGPNGYDIITQVPDEPTEVRE